MRNPPATMPAASGAEPVRTRPAPAASTAVMRWPPGLMSEIASTRSVAGVNRPVVRGLSAAKAGEVLAESRHFRTYDPERNASLLGCGHVAGHLNQSRRAPPEGHVNVEGEMEFNRRRLAAQGTSH